MRERMRHLTLALAVCGVLTVAYAGAILVTVGGIAALGAVLGIALAAGSYLVSTLAIAWADSVEPRLVFPVGMGMYVMKFSLFGAMMVAIGGTDWPGRIPMAFGIVLAVLAWTATQIWWTVRHAHPYVSAP